MPNLTWTDTKVNLPDDDQTVLIVMDDGEVWAGYIDSDQWRYVSGDLIGSRVTHWTHLPEPPEGVTQ